MPLAVVAALAGEGVGEALHAMRPGVQRLRLRLAGQGDGLGADDVLGAGERQHVAELGGVDHGARLEAMQARVVEAHRDDARDAIAVGACGDRLGAPEDRQPAGFDVGLRASGRSRRPRPRGSNASRLTQQWPGLKSAARPASPARGRYASRSRSRSAVIARGAAEGLDVRVLVERAHALCSELPAEPVGLFEQHDLPAGRRRGQRGSDPAGAAADDQDLAALAADAVDAWAGHDRDRCVAARGHPHDIEHGVERAQHASLLSGPSSRAARARSAGTRSPGRARRPAGRGRARSSGRCRPA